MAIDKAVDSAKLDAALVATADAIRAKGGGTAKLAWKETNGFADEIDTLPEDVPEVTQATPSITVSSAGLITASATQSAGKVAAGTKSATKQLTTKAATTYTPKTTNQTISAGQYLTGAQTIAGDANLVAANIVKGKSIFGVAGSAATAVAGQGTVHGRKFVSGTFTPTARTLTTGTISHSLGVVPKGIIIWAENSVNSPSAGDIYSLMNLDFGVVNDYGNQCGVHLMACANYSGSQATMKSGMMQNISSYHKAIGSFTTATTKQFAYGFEDSYNDSYIGSRFTVRFIPVTYKYILFGGV